MEILLIALAVFTAGMLLWLNALATLAVKYDHTLESFQKTAQLLIVWLVPFLGAGIVLRFVFDHQPQAIPRGWIPWPFKGLIYGAPPKLNKHRDDHEIDYWGQAGGRPHSTRGSRDVSDGD